jgi:uncharacterized protein (DUF58 family)
MLDRLWLGTLALVELWALWSGHTLPSLAATLGLLVAASLMLWKRWCLKGVSYRRYLAERRVIQGSEVEFTVEILNLKLLPLTWLRIEDSFPRNVEITGGTVFDQDLTAFRYLGITIAMLPYEKMVRRMRARFNRRGDHVFGPARLESGDYLGLLRNYASAPEIDRLLVLPKIFLLAVGSIASNALVGRDNIRRLLLTDPLRVIGAREYVTGDAYRTIDWRASARVGSLMVRLHEPSTMPILDIVLDFGTMSTVLQNPESDVLEFAISVAASIAGYATERRWAVGMRGNGHSDRMPLYLAPSSAPLRLGEILAALARASPFPSERIDNYLLRTRESPAAPGTSTLVVTMTPSEHLLVAAMTLRKRGRPISIIHVAPAGASGPPNGNLAIWRAVYEPQWTERETLVIGE